MTFSVLKKLCSVGGTVKEGQNTTDSTKTVRQLRLDLIHDLHDLQSLDNSNTQARTLSYDSNGDLTSIVLDEDSENAVNALIKKSLSDGVDLVQTAIVAILDAVNAASSHGIDTQKIGFMECPYTIRALNRKVWIKDSDSVNGFKDVEIMPIREVFRTVRREVAKSRAVQTTSNVYTYLDTVVTDDNGDTYEIYKRLPKYSGLAYEVTDMNGKITAITVDAVTAETADTVVNRMELTRRQNQVLQLRLSGYGKKAIATYLGVTPHAVADTIAAIRKKAAVVGLTPENE